MAIDRLPELRELTVDGDDIEIGAALSLTEIERRLDGRVPLLAELFPQFASRLIRNGATLGGNLGTGSPIGDAPPALLALDATLVLAAQDGEREVLLADYFTGYRETRPAARRADPLRADPPAAGRRSPRSTRSPSVASTTSPAWPSASRSTSRAAIVRRARIGLGGVAATPMRAIATEDALTGQPWTEDTVRRAAAVMAAEGTPMDDHRASASYRSAMLGQALLKLFAENADLEEVGA